MTQQTAIAAGGLVFVPGLSGAGAGAGRDITEQTRHVLAALDAALTAAGSDRAHVATVHVYLRRGEDFAAMNAVYRDHWRDSPPSRTTVVVDLPGDGTLITIGAVAVPRGAERRAIDPPGWAQSPLPYSYCVRAGGAAFLAGLVARDRHTNQPVGGSVDAQLDVIMSNAREILGAAGLSLEQIVSARVYLADAASFDEMNDGWRRHFPAAKPARATVTAGLMQSAYKIEVTFVAHDAPAHHVAADPPNPNLSAAVKAGPMLFVSGMLAPGADDAASEAGDTLAKARAVLGRAGATAADVVETTVWVPDLAHLAAIDAAYQEMFSEAPPARVTVGAGLLAKGARVEIAMNAILA